MNNLDFCTDCKGSCKCAACGGDGVIPHSCSCSLCSDEFEPCWVCENGVCVSCNANVAQKVVGSLGSEADLCYHCETPISNRDGCVTAKWNGHPCCDECFDKWSDIVREIDIEFDLGGVE